VLVFLNGQFVPEEQAVVSVFDRSFLYGDGLFETIRVYAGKPFRWVQHIERLQRGAEFLKIELPFSTEALRDFAGQLIERNQMKEALLRISLSRGVGRRGYSTEGANGPFLAMTLHPASVTATGNPPGWRLVTSSFRVAVGDSVALHKTCNKLPQILARAEAEEQGADEALLLNANGEVAEAASSNLFWIEHGTVCTTPLASGILAGVTRAFVLELCGALTLPTAEKSLRPEALKQAEGVFLTLSSLEVVPVVSLDGHALKQSPVVQQIQRAYREAVLRECA
jgi:aminodeoxychorismate lyase